MFSNGCTHLVIGGGIIGSWTAWHLQVIYGRKTLLVDTFPLPHTRGSSHGGSRVIRYLGTGFVPEVFWVARPLLSEYGLTRVFIRVQAENGKISPTTFPNGFDPRIDLAPFFLPRVLSSLTTRAF